MPDYTKGKIYTIRSYQTDEFYIGSTTQPLCVRFGEHKKKYKAYLNSKYGCNSSFEIIKYDDCYIELLELYSCSLKEELTKKEGELIRTNNCVNKRIPSRTKKEYRKEEKEEIKNQRKKHYAKNKEKIIEKQKQYYQKNKEKILEKQKQYYQENKKDLRRL